MRIERLAIPDVLLISPNKHGDHRGYFSETFRADALAEFGIDVPFVQDNHSFSAARGVLRGLHYQTAPFAQAKLLRVTRGAIFDVAVDLRKASSTFGRHVGVELSADNWRQILVPVGFAHGFCTLAPDTEVLYKVTAPYAPAQEGGLLWSDPALGIEWPISAHEAVLSERDLRWPLLQDLQSPF